MTAANAALAPSIIGRTGLNRAFAFGLAALAGSALMAIAAKVQVPFYPVPVTLQTLAVFLIACAYGRNLAVATMVLYIGEGLMGLPVFAGAEAGPAYMAGPTAGYLAGFVVAAFLIGSAADRGWSRSVVKMAPVTLIGGAIILALGFAWLSILIGAEKAWTFGVLPFLLGDAVKALLAALIVTGLWQVLRRA